MKDTLSQPYTDPPERVLKLLRWFCDEVYLEEVEGDLYELFQEEIEIYGLKKAQNRFLWIAIRYMKPFFFGKKGLFFNFDYHLTMFKHYFKISFRSFGRNALFTFINGFGLLLGILVGIVMLFWAQDELKVDKFHPDSERIQRVYFNGVSPEGEITFTQGASPYALFTKLKETAGVEEVVLYDDRGSRLIKFDEKILKEKGAWSTPSLFKMFDFPMIKGGPETTVNDNKTLFISEDLANRLYGEQWPDTLIGSSIRVNDDTDYILAGIFENVGKNSNFHFDYIFNAHFLTVARGRGWAENWGAKNSTVFVKLFEGTDPDGIEDVINPYYATTDGYGVGGEEMMLFPFEKDYLWTKFEQGVAVSGRIQYVRIFFGAALFLILIACINFINLSTAQAAKRAKEVGVRKTVGAASSNLVGQFLTETGILIFMVLILALGLAHLLLPSLNNISDKAIRIPWLDPSFLLSIIGSGLLLTVVAGLYPAFVLSRFRPAKVLKGYMGRKVNGDYLRKSLVIFQFVLSGILIIATITVQSQLNLIQHENLGLDRDNVISLTMNDPIYEKFDIIKEKLEQYGGTEQIVRTAGSPIDVDWIGTRYTWEGQAPDDGNYFYLMNTEAGFEKVFNIEMAEGRFFDENIQSDEQGIVINEKALDFIQMEDPVGKSILDEEGEQWTILGIAKDFNFRSIHNEIEPLMLRCLPEYTGSMYIKIKDGQTTDVIAQLKSIWAELIPGFPLEFEFIDETYASMYEGERLVGKLAYIFAAIAIIISCLGLFGLVTFIALQKTKEIGIRKVLGASVASIVGLLSKNFIQMVFFSFLIAAPLAWYLMNAWLENFAFRVNLEWPVFLLAGVVAIAVALLTVGFQAIRAALANPVKALRSE